jgi:hypothetical protein
MELIDLALEREEWRAVVNSVMNFLSSCTSDGFPRRTQLREVC